MNPGAILLIIPCPCTDELAYYACLSLYISSLSSSSFSQMPCCSSYGSLAAVTLLLVNVFHILADTGFVPSLCVLLSLT